MLSTHVLMTALVLPPYQPQQSRMPPQRTRVRLPCASDSWEDLSGDGGCLMRRLTSSSETASPTQRTYARVHYRATLENGTVISDSRDAGEPLELRVGMEPSEGVPGWDLALPRMCTGDSAELVCEPKYAFGEAGAPPLIPPAATVTFQLELLGVRDPLESNNTETVDLVDKYARMMARKSQEEKQAQEERGAEGDETYNPFDETNERVGRDGIIDMPAPAGNGASAATAGGAGGGSDGDGLQRLDPRTRTWIPSRREVEVEHASGYTWRETDNEFEVRIPLASESTGTADVAVEIGQKKINVVVLGEAVISGPLCDRLNADESTWSLEREDGEAVLQLDLMKMRPSVGDAPLWGYLLADERDAASAP